MIAEVLAIAIEEDDDEAWDFSLFHDLDDDGPPYYSRTNLQAIAEELRRRNPAIHEHTTNQVRGVVETLVRYRPVEKKAAPGNKPRTATGSRVLSTLESFVGKSDVDNHLRVFRTMQDEEFKLFTRASEGELLERILAANRHLQTQARTTMGRETIKRAMIQFVKFEPALRVHEDEEADDKAEGETNDYADRVIKAAHEKLAEDKYKAWMRDNTSVDFMVLSDNKDGVYFVHNTAKVHPSAIIGADTLIAANAVVEAGVTIGEDCRIGVRSKLCAGVFVEDRVVIGTDCTLENRAWIGDDTTLGSAVRVLSNGMVGGNTEVEHNSVLATVGAHCVIANHVRMDHSSFIGHRCDIGANVRIEQSYLEDHVTLKNSVRLNSTRLHEHTELAQHEWFRTVGPIGSRNDSFTVVEKSGLGIGHVHLEWYVGCQTKPYTTQELVNAVIETHVPTTGIDSWNARTYFRAYKQAINSIWKFRNKELKGIPTKTFESKPKWD